MWRAHEKADKGAKRDQRQRQINQLAGDAAMFESHGVIFLL